MRHALTLVLLACLAPGCAPPNPTTGPAEPPVAPATRPRPELEVEILQARVEELRQRSDLLVEEIRRLKFLNDQLNRQLEAVGDAPRERDGYRLLAARQRILIEQLQQRIAQLEGRPPGGATTAPASQPAEGDEGGAP